MQRYIQLIQTHSVSCQCLRGCSIVIRRDGTFRLAKLEVHFKHRPGESFNVAWRHLNKCPGLGNLWGGNMGECPVIKRWLWFRPGLFPISRCSSGWWFGSFFFHILGITIPIEQYFSEKLKPPISQNLPMESSVKQEKITHDGPLDRYLGPALNGRGVATAWFLCRFSFTDGK